MRRIAAFIPLLAMSLVLMPAAFAQGWDDAASVNKAPQPAPAAPPMDPLEYHNRAHAEMMDRLRAQDEATIQSIRAQTGQSGSDLEKATRRLMGQQGDEGYVPSDSEKWRMEMGPDGNMRVVPDTRGEMPTFENGFGKFNPNGQKEQPDPRQMTTLTPEMVQALQKRAAEMGPPGSSMYEKAGSSGFFGGMKPPKEAIQMDPSEFKVHQDHGEPAWAKDRLNKVHHYVDGQEHHGAEDPHGFF